MFFDVSDTVEMREFNEIWAHAHKHRERARASVFHIIMFYFVNPLCKQYINMI